MDIDTFFQNIISSEFDDFWTFLEHLHYDSKKKKVCGKIIIYSSKPELYKKRLKNAKSVISKYFKNIDYKYSKPRASGLGAVYTIHFCGEQVNI